MMVHASRAERAFALLRLALRNVFRHAWRSAMTLAAIGFGVAAIILAGGFVRDMYKKLGESIIHSQTGHVQIARPTFFGEGSRSPERHLIADLSSLEASLSKETAVKVVTARLIFGGLLSNGRTDLPIAGEGIEPGKERELMTSSTIVEGRMLSSRDTSGVVVGEGLAKALKLRAGDSATLLSGTVDGAMNTIEVEVVGIFRSFSRDYDSHAVKVTLQAAQELMATPSANVVVLLLNDTRDTDPVLSHLGRLTAASGLTARTWQQLSPFYESTVQLYDRQFGVLMLIILLLVALGVANTVNLAVLERLSEFGTMRAMGNRGTYVAKLVMTECALLGAIGAIAGTLIGIALAVLISAIGIPMPPPPNSNIGYTAAIEIVQGVVLQAASVGFLATTLAGAIPALRARAIPIVNALQQSV